MRVGIKSVKCVYNIIYVSALTLAVLTCLESYMGMSFVYGYLVAVTVAAATVSEIVAELPDYARYRIWAAAGIIYLAGVMRVSYVYVHRYDEDYVYNEKLLLAVEALLSVVLVIVLYRLAVRIKHIRKIIPCALLAALIAARITGVDISLATTVMVLYVSAINACGIRNDEHYIYFTPVILFMCTVMYFVPTRTEPISWEGITDAAEKVGDIIGESWDNILDITGLGKIIFGKTGAGYTDADELEMRDNIEGSDRLQLKVTANDSVSNVYLRGSYYNVYEGDRWTKEYSEPEYPEYEVSLFETYNRLMHAVENKVYYPDSVKRLKMNIMYEELETKSVFAPYNMIYTDLEENISYGDGTLAYNKDRKKGDNYNVTYIYVDRDVDRACASLCGEIEGHHGASGIVNFAEADTGCRLIGKIDTDLIIGMDDYLDDRDEYVYSNYTQIPECVTGRVYELADEITDGAGSNYEKALKIEQYLSDNYRYSLEPKGNDGNGECYVEKFLFETREGSCLHFASAMAVLARCLNIPSRIVTGYCLQYSNPLGIRVQHNVDGSDAHAWPEIYIDSLGWYEFEPTFGYTEKFYNSDFKASGGDDGTEEGKTQEDAKNDNTPTPEPLKEDNDKASVTPAATAASQDISGDFGGTGAGGADNDVPPSSWHVIAVTGTIAVILMVLCVALAVVRNRYKAADKSNVNVCRKNIYAILRKYEKVMKKKGRNISMRKYTLNESADIMADWLGNNLRDYKRVIDAYQANVFGGIRISSNIAAVSRRLKENAKA